MSHKIEVEVEIDSTGQLRVEVKGKKGRSCLELQQLIEAALGPASESRYTAEFYEPEVSTHQTLTTKK